MQIFADLPAPSATRSSHGPNIVWEAPLTIQCRAARALDQQFAFTMIDLVEPQFRPALKHEIVASALMPIASSAAQDTYSAEPDFSVDGSFVASSTPAQLPELDLGF